MNESILNRRMVLRGLGATSVGVALAGCSNYTDSDDEAPTEADSVDGSVDEDASTGVKSDVSTIYATTEADRIYAADADTGEELDIFEPPVEYIDDVIVHNGSIYFGNGAVFGSPSGDDIRIEEGGLHGLNAITGELEFEFPVPEATRSPIIHDGIAYLPVSTTEIKLYAIELDTEEVLWTFEETGAFLRQPIVDDGILYIGAEIEHNDGAIFAVDAKSGDLNWRFDRPNDSVSQPSIYEGTLYVAGGDTGGDTLYAVDSESGDELWTYEGEYLNKPEVVNNTIYVSAGPVSAGPPIGSIHAVDPDSGEQKWLFDEADGRLTMTIAHGTIYASSNDNTVYAIDAESGELDWTFTTEGKYATEITVHGDLVYVPDDDGALYALDAFSGDEEWVLDPWNDTFQNQFPTVVDTPEDGDSVDSRVRLRTGAHHYEEINSSTSIDG